MNRLSKENNLTGIPAVLVLENGIIFHGTSIGAEKNAGGEVCFNTGMTGYQETFTDPSYHGQILTMTYPHIGNYGVNDIDNESQKIQIAGLVVKDLCDTPSNFQSQSSLQDYLKEQNITGIQDVDTRALTKIIRSEGAMNALISTDVDDIAGITKTLDTVPKMTGLDLVSKVTCKESYPYPPPKEMINNKYHVAVVDYGVKTNILKQLTESGCRLTVYPAATEKEQLLAAEIDGVFLSNGPGDPAAVNYGIDLVKSLLGKKPIFGICLGHQILCHALGASTYKLKFGHRGCNHPVKNLSTGRVEITSQNHGFAVAIESLPESMQATHISLNDNTLEGIQSLNFPAFSVQYHPESSPGPHDSRYLFNHFIELMDQQ
jgi:carbamoyl-phosphate synthase small subunit